MRTGPSKPSRRQRGAALMLVIWLIAILALAVISALRVITFDMEIATAKVHGASARYIAEMGIAVGSNPAVKRTDPLLHYLNEETGEGYDVTIASEGGRLGINAILLRDDKALLRNIFMDWGLNIDDAQLVTDALGDWVDTDDDQSLNGAEKSWYESQGRINQPFNRPFYSLDEVRLVRGMELVEAVKPDWREWFSVWSSGLDVNDAPAELIAAAAEVAVDLADIIPETVRGPDGIRDTVDDVPFDSPSSALMRLGVDIQARPDIGGRFASSGETTTRIESTGHTAGARRKITVVLRNRTGQPALLERTEEILP